MHDFLQGPAVKAQDALDARENPPTTGSECSECHHVPLDQNQTWFRCQDCPILGQQCQTCIIHGHRHRPFDRLRRWNTEGEYWEKLTMSDLDFTLYLGHGTSCCPHIPQTATGSPLLAFLRDTTIVHEHGVMKMPIAYCRCPFTRPEPEQLIATGLWPATWDRPKTAITLNTLEAFYGLTLQAQVNLHDFVLYLKRCTDAVRTEEVAVSTHLIPPMYANSTTGTLSRDEHRDARIRIRQGLSKGGCPCE